jgi:hypothetical protein
MPTPLEFNPIQNYAAYHDLAMFRLQSKSSLRNIIMNTYQWGPNAVQPGGGLQFDSEKSGVLVSSFVKDGNTDRKRTSKDFVNDLNTLYLPLLLPSKEHAFLMMADILSILAYLGRSYSDQDIPELLSVSIQDTNFNPKITTFLRKWVDHFVQSYCSEFFPKIDDESFTEILTRLITFCRSSAKLDDFVTPNDHLFAMFSATSASYMILNMCRAVLGQIIARNLKPPEPKCIPLQYSMVAYLYCEKLVPRKQTVTTKSFWHIPGMQQMLQEDTPGQLLEFLHLSNFFPGQFFDRTISTITKGYISNTHSKRIQFQDAVDNSVWETMKNNKFEPFEVNSHSWRKLVSYLTKQEVVVRDLGKDDRVVRAPSDEKNTEGSQTPIEKPKRYRTEGEEEGPTNRILYAGIVAACIFGYAMS